MPSCVIRYCTNYTSKTTKSGGITYHSFPSDKLRCIKWVDIVRKQRREEGWKPNKSSKICSIHFKDEDMYTSGKGLILLKKSAFPLVENVSLSSARVVSNAKDEDAGTSGSEDVENTSKDTNVSLSSARVVSNAKDEDAGTSGSEDVENTSKDTEQDAPRAESPNSLENVDISDLDYVFDTPAEAALKKVIEKLKLDKKKLVKRNIALARQNRVYKKRLSSVNYNLKMLLKKNVLSQEQYSVLNLKSVIISVKQNADSD